MAMDVKSMGTEELQQILRKDAANPNGGMPWEELEPILMELTRRINKDVFGNQEAEEVWREFQVHYLQEG